MTREEAISWLKEFKWHEGEDVPIYETDIEAIDMAIKALEQEPILDKLRADIKVAYDELDGYDPYSLGTFASRIDDLIDNLLAESEG